MEYFCDECNKPIPEERYIAVGICIECEESCPECKEFYGNCKCEDKP